MISDTYLDTLQITHAVTCCSYEGILACNSNCRIKTEGFVEFDDMVRYRMNY